MLWVLDTSINVSMEPFRAFVADKLPAGAAHHRLRHAELFHRHRRGCRQCATRRFFKHYGVTGNAANGVPLAVQYAFKLGAVVFLLAVLWTVLTSREYPPADMEEFRRKRREHKHFHVDVKFVCIAAPGRRRCSASAVGSWWTSI